MVLKHIPSDALEWVIDQFTENELVKSLPVVSTVVSLYGTAKDISSLLFMKKLQSFLEDLQLQSEEDIEKMRTRLGNEDEKRDIGERLLIILNASTEMEKSKLIAKVFRAYIDGKITRQQLDSIWNVLDKCYLEHLKEYVHTNTDETTSNPIVLPLAGQGLFTVSNKYFSSGTHYNKTDFGYFVNHILFDTKLPEEYMAQEYDFGQADKNPYKKT